MKGAIEFFKTEGFGYFHAGFGIVKIDDCKAMKPVDHEEYKYASHTKSTVAIVQNIYGSFSSFIEPCTNGIHVFSFYKPEEACCHCIQKRANNQQYLNCEVKKKTCNEQAPAQTSFF
jgi:hypothetical protein